MSTININKSKTNALDEAFLSSELLRVDNRLNKFMVKDTKLKVKRLAERLYEDNRWLSTKTPTSVHLNKFTGISMSNRYATKSNRKMSASLHINDGGSCRVNIWHAGVLENNSLFNEDMELIKSKFGGNLSINKSLACFKDFSIDEGIDFMKKATEEYKVMGG